MRRAQLALLAVANDWASGLAEALGQEREYGTAMVAATGCHGAGARWLEEARQIRATAAQRESVGLTAAPAELVARGRRDPVRPGGCARSRSRRYVPTPGYPPRADRSGGQGRGHPQPRAVLAVAVPRLQTLAVRTATAR